MSTLLYSAERAYLLHTLVIFRSILRSGTYLSASQRYAYRTAMGYHQRSLLQLRRSFYA
jgi:hypothetical protein